MTTKLQKRILTSIVLIFLLIAMYLFSFVMIISLIIIAIIVWIYFLGLLSKIIKNKDSTDKFLEFFYKVVSLLYLFMLVYLIFAIESYYIDLKIYLFYSILVAILSDIGGFVFGKTFKGKKLTKISPNKTISGSFGSFIFSLFLILIFYNDITKFNLSILIFITISISASSQLGDLLISYLKRKAKVKDTSDMLPGHGGFLDRVDGIIFAIPVGILLFNFL